MRFTILRARSRTLARIAWRSALVLILVLAVAVAYLTLAFDPNRLKPEIAGWVQSNYQRQLTITGDIRLKWWPGAHLEVSGASLSQPNGAAPFASLRRAMVTLRLAPLLRKQVRVDALTFEGFSLDVQRFADGRWSIDDLLRSDGNATLKVDIASLVLRDASISVHDAASGQRWRVSNLQMTAGPIALDKPGTLTAGFELVDEPNSARAKVAITNTFLMSAQSGLLELGRLDMRASGQVSDVAVEQLQASAASLRRAGERWELRDVRLTGGATRGPERLAFHGDCSQLVYMTNQWHADGIRTQMTRELPQTQKQLLAKQEFNLSLDAVQGDAQQILAPTSKLQFASQDVLGKWSGSLLGAAAYKIRAGEWRLSQAQADATWRADAGTQLHLVGTGAVIALPVQGVWRAEDFAFTLTGTLPLGQLEASGRARASAEVPAQRFALALDPMQVALSNQTLRVEAKNTSPLHVDLVNDALAGELNAAHIRVRDTDLDLAGTLDLALAGTRAGAVYTFRPLAVEVSGKRAGAGMKAALRGELSVNTQTQRLSAPKLQVNAQFDAASGAAQLRRAALTGALTIDAFDGRLRFETPNTAISVNSLLSMNKNSDGILIGVFDFDWNKRAGSFTGRASLEATNATGRVGWAYVAAEPTYSFDLDIDTVDWDKLKAGTSAKRPASTATAAPFDVAQMRALRAKGVARIAALKANGVTAKNVVLEVQ